MKMKINGQSDIAGGVVYVSYYHSPTPKRVDERVEINGKYGTEVIGFTFEDRHLEVEGVLRSITGNRKDLLRSLATLLKIEEKTVLINFSNDNKVFYVGSFESMEIDNDRTTPSSTFFFMKFICKPELYKITDDMVDLSLIETESDILSLDEEQYVYTVIPE